jgi:hypothetical protein
LFNDQSGSFGVNLLKNTSEIEWVPVFVSNLVRVEATDTAVCITDLPRRCFDGNLVALLPELYV